MPGRDRLARDPAYDVVGCPGEVAGLRPALLAADLRNGGEQGRRDHGRVHVDPRQVDDAAVGGPVELLPGGWPVLGPGRLVPAVPQHDATAGRPAGGLHLLQAVGEAGCSGEVEAGEGEPGRGGVHVGVDEGRGDQGAGQVDDLVGLARDLRGVRADPGDGAAAHEQRGRTGVVGRADPAVAVERRGRRARRRCHGRGGHVDDLSQPRRSAAARTGPGPPARCAAGPWPARRDPAGSRCRSASSRRPPDPRRPARPPRRTWPSRRR